MPRQNLTDRAIKAAKPAASARDISDALVPGLAVRVLPSGAKSFVLVARFPGSSNPTRRSIGPYPVVSLQDARDKAREWIALIQRGIDPANEVRREREETVATVIEDYIARKVVGRNPEQPNFRGAARTIHYLRGIVVPIFGSRPIAQLTSREVSVAIAHIEQYGTDHGMVRLGARKELRHPNSPSKPAPVQARQLLSWFDSALRWAAGTGDYGIDISPLQRINKQDRFGSLTRRDRVLTDEELGAAWRASGALEAPYRQLYRMLMLTGLRLSEVRDASWNEIDLKAKTWTIPAARMKGRNGSARAHRVPLTPLMLSVLNEVRQGFLRVSGGHGGGFTDIVAEPKGPFVFSVNLGESPVSAGGTFKKMLDREIAYELRVPAGEHFTNHDIRRTVRTRGSMLGIPDDVGEAMLAHRRPGIIGTYDTNDRFEERRKAHVMWGEFLLALADKPKVVKLPRKSTRAA